MQPQITTLLYFLNFCSQNLRGKHKECYESNQEGINQLGELFHEILTDVTKLENANQKIGTIKNKHLISQEQLRLLIANNWEMAVEKSLEDGILSIKEEENLVKIKEHFNLDQNELDKKNGIKRLTQAAILRDILEGKLPERIKFDFDHHLNLQKGESILWLFQKTDYYEDKTVREYQGGSRGVSLRIAKGVYYSFGSFRGKTVSKTERTLIDKGLMAITNKHIYFVGSSKSFKIKLDKIVSFAPYDDGVGIQKDGTTAKPQTFINQDGWFSYNLLVNLSKL